MAFPDNYLPDVMQFDREKEWDYWKAAFADFRIVCPNFSEDGGGDMSKIATETPFFQSGQEMAFESLQTVYTPVASKKQRDDSHKVAIKALFNGNTVPVGKYMQSISPVSQSLDPTNPSYNNLASNLYTSYPWEKNLGLFVRLLNIPSSFTSSLLDDTPVVPREVVLSMWLQTYQKKVVQTESTKELFKGTVVPLKLHIRQPKKLVDKEPEIRSEELAFTWLADDVVRELASVPGVEISFITNDNVHGNAYGTTINDSMSFTPEMFESLYINDTSSRTERDPGAISLAMYTITEDFLNSAVRMTSLRTVLTQIVFANYNDVVSSFHLPNLNNHFKGYTDVILLDKWSKQSHYQKRSVMKNVLTSLLEKGVTDFFYPIHSLVEMIISYMTTTKALLTCLVEKRNDQIPNIVAYSLTNLLRISSNSSGIKEKVILHIMLQSAPVLNAMEVELEKITCWFLQKMYYPDTVRDEFVQGDASSSMYFVDFTESNIEKRIFSSISSLIYTIPPSESMALSLWWKTYSSTMESRLVKEAIIGCPLKQVCITFADINGKLRKNETSYCNLQVNSEAPTRMQHFGVSYVGIISPDKTAWEEKILFLSEFPEGCTIGFGPVTGSKKNEIPFHCVGLDESVLIVGKDTLENEDTGAQDKIFKILDRRIYKYDNYRIQNFLSIFHLTYLAKYGQNVKSAYLRTVVDVNQFLQGFFHLISSNLDNQFIPNDTPGRSLAILLGNSASSANSPEPMSYVQYQSVSHSQQLQYFNHWLIKDKPYLLTPSNSPLQDSRYYILQQRLTADSWKQLDEFLEPEVKSWLTAFEGTLLVLFMHWFSVLAPVISWDSFFESYDIDPDMVRVDARIDIVVQLIENSPSCSSLCNALGRFEGGTIRNSPLILSLSKVLAREWLKYAHSNLDRSWKYIWEHSLRNIPPSFAEINLPTLVDSHLALTACLHRRIIANRFQYFFLEFTSQKKEELLRERLAHLRHLMAILTMDLFRWLEAILAKPHTALMDQLEYRHMRKHIPQKEPVGSSSSTSLEKLCFDFFNLEKNFDENPLAQKAMFPWLYSYWTYDTEESAFIKDTAVVIENETDPSEHSHPFSSARGIKTSNKILNSFCSFRADECDQDGFLEIVWNQAKVSPKSTPNRKRKSSKRSRASFDSGASDSDLSFISKKTKIQTSGLFYHHILVVVLGEVLKMYLEHNIIDVESGDDGFLNLFYKSSKCYELASRNLQFLLSSGVSPQLAKMVDEALNSSVQRDLFPSFFAYVRPDPIKFGIFEQRLLPFQKKMQSIITKIHPNLNSFSKILKVLVYERAAQRLSPSTPNYSTTFRSLGLKQEPDFRVLCQYPINYNMYVRFSSHTFWELNSKNDLFNEMLNGFTFIHTIALTTLGKVYLEEVPLKEEGIAAIWHSEGKGYGDLWITNFMASSYFLKDMPNINTLIKRLFSILTSSITLFLDDPFRDLFEWIKKVFPKAAIPNTVTNSLQFLKIVYTFVDYMTKTWILSSLNLLCNSVSSMSIVKRNTFPFVPESTLWTTVPLVIPGDFELYSLPPWASLSNPCLFLEQFLPTSVRNSRALGIKLLPPTKSSEKGAKDGKRIKMEYNVLQLSLFKFIEKVVKLDDTFNNVDDVLFT